MIGRNAVLVGLMMLVQLGAAPVDQKQFAQFLAGVMIIRSNPRLSDGEMAQKFRNLESLCAISSAEVLELINSYKSKPEQWKVVNEMIKEMILEHTVRKPGEE